MELQDQNASMIVSSEAVLWVEDGYLLLVCSNHFFLCVQVARERESMSYLGSLPISTLILFDQDPTHMVSFNFYHLFKSPISKTLKVKASIAEFNIHPVHNKN
jgi:hypothetical protein